MNNWKFEELKRNTTTKKLYSRPGTMAGHVEMDSVSKIEIGHHINGSGPDCFGGAKQWPHVQLNVNFNEDEQPLAELFAKQLMQFVDKFFEEHEQS